MDLFRPLIELLKDQIDLKLLTGIRMEGEVQFMIWRHLHKIRHQLSEIIKIPPNDHQDVNISYFYI